MTPNGTRISRSFISPAPMSKPGSAAVTPAPNYTHFDISHRAGPVARNTDQTGLVAEVVVVFEDGGGGAANLPKAGIPCWMVYGLSARQ